MPRKTATQIRPTSAATSAAASGRPDTPEIRASDLCMTPDNLGYDDTTPPATDADLVKETLRLIMRDPLAPAAAKAQAARTMAEMLMMLGRAQQPPVDPSKPITELTRSALEAELAAIRSASPA